MEVCDKITTAYKTMDDSIGTCSDNTKFDNLINTALDTYSMIIKNFFMNKQTEIKGIYDAIRGNDFPYNMVNAPDVNLATYSYSEYSEGMNEFIHKIISLRDDDELNVDAITSTIGKVNERDHEFINHLFDDRKDSTIDMAMKNVEVLVDLYSEMDGFKALSKELYNGIIENNTNVYKDCVNAGMTAYAKSVNYYNYMCIYNIFTIYDSIVNSMKVRTPAIHKNVEVYKIF